MADARSRTLITVDDLVRLLDHVGWDSALLAGASMGGCVSLAFAGKYPKNSPVEQHTANATITLNPLMGTRKFPGIQGWMITGIASPIKIPSTAPPPLIRNASIKN